MLNDFFVRAMLGGIGVALAAGPLGCFIVWRRMAYFGDTMAHAALLGVVLGILLQLPLSIGILGVSMAGAVILVLLERQRTMPTDTLLGILSHSSLSLGLVAVAFMSWVRLDLMALLFGDILAVGRGDLLVIWGGSLFVLVVLAAIWRPLLAGTVNADLARAEGVPAGAARLAFMLLIAMVIAIAMKIVGVLLITSLLIIPAATARRFSGSPEAMAGLAALAGVAAVALGLFGSLEFDTPSGPSIVVAALTIFVVTMALPSRASGQ
ncbi:metal ABC transporter permease [Lutibaculum baratangense]|nr:metal ABC transporter permease [Lutibaculum baratangense]